ncbi:MAG TPA: septal ring lytic transglycosylase RlpA family protein [Mariprofundaceae bacterium]|nr:septal ring lytic transglycosylase RlpA family protein [Mariprofundaceae bacterium]
MPRRLIHITVIAVLALSMSACVKHRNAPKSYSHTAPVDSSRSASNLPDGSGGVRKTGKPYRIAGKWYYPMQTVGAYDETGTASWYGRDFHGKKTANGERYDMHALSAAHKTLPMPTLVRVTNLENGRSVVVRVNDRGPFVKNRIIDLSYAAARQLGYDNKGTAHVRVQTLDQPAPTMAARELPAARSVITSPAALPPIVPATWTNSNSTPSGTIYVQLGAFSSEGNAVQLRNAVSGMFSNVLIQPRHIASQTLYRVRIGPFDDMRKIESTVQTLQQNGYDDAVVIIE